MRCAYGTLTWFAHWLWQQVTSLDCLLLQPVAGLKFRKPSAGVEAEWMLGKGVDYGPINRTI